MSIPLMCYLAVKRDYDMRPHRAKNLFFVLGNHGDRYWYKNKNFALVISYLSLHQHSIMAIEHWSRLIKVDCKNALCNATLLNNKNTIIKTSIGWPFSQPDKLCLLKKTLYGLQRCPRHWFDKITSTLNTLGLKSSPHDPCVYTLSLIPGRDKIYIGLYVKNFVYFSESDAVE